LKAERTRVTNRMKGLLANQGARLTRGQEEGLEIAPRHRGRARGDGAIVGRLERCRRGCGLGCTGSGPTRGSCTRRPAQCAEFLGCRARRGQKLSIRISHFYASLDAYDLKLSLSSAGCSGVAVAPEEFIVQLDGVAGTPSSLHYASEVVFTWAPFPEAPTVLALIDLLVEKLA
jgi:hypothetical protein